MIEQRKSPSRKLIEKGVVGIATLATVGAAGVIGYNLNRGEADINSAPSATAEHESPMQMIDGLMPLNEEQRHRLNTTARENVMNEFGQLFDGEDTYNAFNHLMAQEGSTTAWMRWTQSPETGVNIGYEVVYGLAPEGYTGSDLRFAYFQFANNSPEAIQAIEDGRLTCGEVQGLLSSNETKLEIAVREHPNGEVAQAIVEPGGVVIELGNKENLGHDDPTKFSGLNPVQDPKIAQSQLDYILEGN